MDLRLVFTESCCLVEMLWRHFICFFLVTFTDKHLQSGSVWKAKHIFKNYVIIYEYYGQAINIYLIITEAKPIK